MALRKTRAPAVLYGSATPRIAPVAVPARSQVPEFHALAAELGLSLYPWQETAARYLTALGVGDQWLYREVAIIVARQNGKTTLLVPHIVARLRAGRRIMHTAQNRELPREVFAEVADRMMALYPDELRTKPRFANGQEEIRLLNGGRYRIVAPTRGGARGPSNDDLIVDELREMVTHDFMAAAKPTLTASTNPQTVYLSNAGTDDSVVLNALKARAAEDPSLAYLEWSANPERTTDDLQGWLESNPSIGHAPQTLPNLESEHRAHALAGTLRIYNIEHLCRWETTDLPSLVPLAGWERARGPELKAPPAAALGLAVDPNGSRASMALAWQDRDGGTRVQSLGDVTGSPIDADALGRELRKQAVKAGVAEAGYDPETDAHLAKYLRKSRPVTGAQFTAACSYFVTEVEGGRLRWDGPDEWVEDMRWTARRTDPSDGTFRAVKAKEDRPITSILAAIRAVWVASVLPASSGRRSWA